MVGRGVKGKRRAREERGREKEWSLKGREESLRDGGGRGRPSVSEPRGVAFGYS